MAAPVKPLRAAAIVILLAVLPQPPLAAEPLDDPTRNPLLGRGEDAASAAPAPVAPPTRLQMIVRGPGETRSAVIDGNKVGLGDTIVLRGGPARIERITDTTVVLARGGTLETLQLLPGTDRAVRCVHPTGPRRNGGC